MRLAGILRDSIVDGVGIRDVIFFQGCLHNCPGCHNQHTHSLKGGVEIDPVELADQLKDSSNDITISGDEPLLQIGELLTLLQHLYFTTEKKIWLYTGNRLAEISESVLEQLAKLRVEVLVDGRFEIDKKSDDLLYRGSSNQRLIDLKNTLFENEVVLWSEE